MKKEKVFLASTYLWWQMTTGEGADYSQIVVLGNLNFLQLFFSFPNLMSDRTLSTVLRLHAFLSHSLLPLQF